jgi:hypothetical protein
MMSAIGFLFEDISDARGDGLQLPDFVGGVFAGSDCPDTESPDNFGIGPNWNTERAADAGLYCAGFGDAAGIGLQIADGDGPVLRDNLAGDALPYRNGFYDFEYLGRQTGVRGQVQQLFLRVKGMNCAGFGTKLFQCFAKDSFEWIHAW